MNEGMEIDAGGEVIATPDGLLVKKNTTVS